jgi:hypothetical protein
VAQATITINIHCDRAASKPLVTLESEEFGSYTFRHSTAVSLSDVLFLVRIIERLKRKQLSIIGHWYGNFLTKLTLDFLNYCFGKCC